MKNSTRFFLLFIGILFINIPAFAIIRYVKPIAAGLGNGTTWANASADPQAMINASVSGDEVWVSAGTYLPTRDIAGSISPADARTKTFLMKSGVAVYGGFAGTETLLSQQNTTANVTILSGDFSNNDVVTGAGATLSLTNNTENAYHVVTVNNPVAATRLDGFTVKGGNADLNTIFLGFTGANRNGGGIFNNNGGTNFTLISCTLANNNADNLGGGMYNIANASPNIINCTFTNNNAVNYGGGIFNFNANPNITNCIITNNNSSFLGGGIAIFFSSPNITNCTFTNNNTGTLGSAIYNTNANSSIKNCIIWGNTGGGSQSISNASSIIPTVTYSNVEGGYAGTGNINSDPLFMNSADFDGADNIYMTADDGLRLNCGSPAFNVGDNTGAPATDILDIVRPQFTTVDMGAYESTINLSSGSRLYVDASVVSSGNGTSWASPLKTLQEALDNNCSITEIWVKNGTYFPTKDIAGNLSPANARTKTFLLESGVAIYGGFAGTETALSQRNLALGNNSILSGNINATPAITDDVYHVVYYQNANISTILNGFIIQNGNANLATANNDLGGGVFCSGVGFISTPKIQNCIFTNNFASNAGGGIFANGAGSGSNASPEITNCVFTNNTATNNGAAISANGDGVGNASPSVYNCTFVNNNCPTVGVLRSIVLYYGFSNATFQNNIFSNNTPDLNLVRNTATGVMLITNNHTPTTALGTNPTTGNPFFTNVTNPDGADGLWFTADDGLQLNCNSLCYNTGLNTGVFATDIRDLARIQFTTVDKGAYESDINLSSITRLYVDASIASSGVGFSWATAFKTLQEALDNTCVVTEIWVKQGTYYPTKDIIGNLSPANARTKTFLMKSGIAVYGGFVGTETLLSQRNLALGNNSILSGDFLNNDTGFTNNTENAYHVVYYQNANISTILNGFIIQNGNANLATANNDLGGGVFCSGVGFISTPKIQNCIFTNNFASNAGGGIFANGAGSGSNASPEITNCVFTNNTATNNGAAISANGIAVGNASPSVYNCTFVNNTCPTVSVLRSIVLYYGFSSTTFQNNIFYNNTPDLNLVRNTASGAMVITNNHTPVTALGINPTTGDPLFVNVSDPNGADNLWFTADDGLEILYANSVCNNTGLATNAPATDIVGMAILCSKDKGAFEVNVVALSATTLTRLYVKKGITTGTKDGSTWANAFPEVSEALNIAQNAVGNAITEIWVSTGTYLPAFDVAYNACPGDNRTKTFLMKSGVAVFGGFAGTETLLAQRNWTTNATVLSGDFDNDDVVTGAGFTLSFSGNGENAMHVVAVNRPTTATRLDGFTVKGGNANINSDFLGLASTNQNGGGVYCTREGTNFILINCTIVHNSATADGGGMNNYISSPNITNCIFANNRADSNGGGMMNIVSSPNITNCIFANNRTKITSSSSGAGITNASSSPNIRNCIIWGNLGPSFPSNPSIANFSSTPIVTYSCVQGGYVGTGNLSGNPLFVNSADPDGADNIFMTADDGLALQCTSPCINTGTNTGAPALDILSNAMAGTVKDMGAYEVQNGGTFPTSILLATAPESNLILVKQCENAGWTYYAPASNSTKWLIGINWAVDGTLSPLNSTAKNAAQVKITLDAAPTSAENIPLQQGIWTTGRYWDVSIGANTINEPVNIRYYFDPAEINAINTAANAFAIANGGVYIPAKFFKTVGSAFNPATQVTYNNINSGNVITLTPNTTPTGTHNSVPYVEFTAISSFSGGGAFAQVGVTPLPVELLSFSGKNQNNTNILTWATTNEVNNAYFEIERSNNAIDFVKIGVVNANTINESIKNYNFTDVSFSETANYYRLKQIDNNGKTDYSKVIAIKSGKNTDISVDIYPNPSKNTFIIDVNGDISAKYSVVVYDMQGRSVVNTEFSGNKCVISLDNYVSGVYFVKINSENCIITRKIVKN